MKLVLVFTGGRKETVNISGGITWKEAKEQAIEQGIKFPKGDIVVKQMGSKVQYNDESKLPNEAPKDGVEVNVVATVMPKESSGGALKGARLEVSIIIKKDGDKARKHFNKDKNWTNKKTEELEKLLKKYKGTSTAIKEEKPKKVKVPKKGKTTVIKEEAPIKTSTGEKTIDELLINLEGISKSFNDNLKELKGRIGNSLIYKV